MALDMRLQQKLQQKLVMTPQLRQAIKILQLQREELETLIDEELAENPVLERAEGEEPLTTGPQTETEIATVDSPTPTPQDDINWQAYLDNYSNDMPALPATGSDDDDDDRLNMLENVLTRAESLADHLSEQLRFHALSPEEERTASVIIGNLDVDGYLKASLEELASGAGVGVELAAYVLQLIQSCDPTGVAAHDLRECLLLQLRAQALEDPNNVEDPLIALAIRIVHDHLTVLEGRRFDRLAKDLGVTVDEVTHAVRLITTLEPKPGRNFGEGETRYVTPDVDVRKMGDEYLVTLNEEGLPRLKVSQSYRRMLAGGGDAKDYIQDKLRSAAWLIKSIHQRQHTLLQVAQSIVKFQGDFLTHGVSQMHPLVLRDIAEDVGIHESTVSRAIANKYMATPRGIFSMKRFFTTGLKSHHGQDVAAESVKEQIREFITKEDPTHPLSDEDIAKRLSQSNVDIARRTVAKYREAMNIPPSAKRKQGP